MSQRLGVPVAVAPDCSDCSECSCMKTGGIMQTGSSTAVHAELNMHLCRHHCMPLHATACHTMPELGKGGHLSAPLPPSLLRELFLR